jgi:hypothetical protein
MNYFNMLMLGFSPEDICRILGGSTVENFKVYA